MSLTFDAGVAAGLSVSAVVAVGGPLVLALVLWRKLGASPKAWLFGALTFVVSQLVLRLPWQIPLNAWLAPKIADDTAATFGWIAVSALTAGLFEETGRWFAYRWLWKDRSTLGGVMLGAGHGGIESILLVGLSLVSSVVVYVALSHGVTLGIPAEVLPKVEAQFAPVTPALALMGGVERIAAWALHIACSLLVLEGARSGLKRWLLLSIGVHAALNLVAVGVTKAVNPFAGEAATVVFAGLALFLALRRSRASTFAPWCVVTTQSRRAGDRPSRRRSHAALHQRVKAPRG